MADQMDNLKDIMALLVEILVLIIKSFFYMVESVYRRINPQPEKSITDDIVLITGTGHGIGKALALQFAELSAKVVCVDINEQSNLETVKEINAKSKAKAYAYRCDVSSLENVRELGDKVKSEVGTVTILVNNAGIMPCKPLEAHNEATIRKLFDINVFAHFWMLDTFLPGMKALKKGHVVSLSSMAGIIGLQNLVPYCASKFAVRGLNEAMVDECQENGFKDIKFTCIYPYMVDTGLCQKPKIRFPSLLPLVTPESTAKEIISAVRRDYLETTIPSSLLLINNIFRCVPVKMAFDFKEFMGGGVDAHED
ncbi:short-chain dehydrogenase/reductase family 16C member 6-like [Adelges cooleyi]|uniref:short-chain dehydrogenase/reductase family 16C member 6-like n=1 Tax=Adelges cooleyi TaxID=133065 RepID=UPI00217F7B4C|nr:short-chain dehydrogenase/reductase family 16C member 6-like [Adelges cooleyi]XP_050440865.1 short-chain dehydrogenase/reductase family 16C member 6-like [Adelges cooleyi]